MRIRVLSITILLLLSVSASYSQDELNALGDNYGCIVIGAGDFIPTTGTGGLSVHAGFYRQNFSRLLLGGEISYTKFKSRLFMYDDVGFSTIGITTTLKYFIPREKTQPYFGAYVSVGFHSIDENDTPGISLKSHVAASYGIGLLLGATTKISDNLLLFFEGRYGGDWMREELVGYDEEIRNYGGFTIMGGLMFLF